MFHCVLHLFYTEAFYRFSHEWTIHQWFTIECQIRILGRYRDYQSLFGKKACAQQKAIFSSTAEDLQVWTSPKVFTIGRFKSLLTMATATGRATKTFTYKVNLRCLKLCRTYSISFNSSNVGKYFWSWILKDCIKVQEKKKKVAAFTNMQIRRVSNVVSPSCPTQFINCLAQE